MLIFDTDLHAVQKFFVYEASSLLSNQVFRVYAALFIYVDTLLHHEVGQLTFKIRLPRIRHLRVLTLNRALFIVISYGSIPTCNIRLDKGVTHFVLQHFLHCHEQVVYVLVSVLDARV